MDACASNDSKHFLPQKCYSTLCRVDQKFLHFREMLKPSATCLKFPRGASANLQADGASNLYFLEICNLVFHKVNQFFSPPRMMFSPRKKFPSVFKEQYDLP